jgi:hypothetical protein
MLRLLPYIADGPKWLIVRCDFSESRLMKKYNRKRDIQEITYSQQETNHGWSPTLNFFLNTSSSINNRKLNSVQNANRIYLIKREDDACESISTRGATYRISCVLQQTIDEWGEEKIDALKSFFCWIRGFLKTSLPSHSNTSCTDYISGQKQTREHTTQFHSFLKLQWCMTSGIDKHLVYRCIRLFCTDRN